MQKAGPRPLSSLPKTPPRFAFNSLSVLGDKKKERKQSVSLSPSSSLPIQQIHQLISINPGPKRVLFATAPTSTKSFPLVTAAIVNPFIKLSAPGKFAENWIVMLL